MLFAIFLDDLEDYAYKVSVLELTEPTDENVATNLQLFVLYSDDTVIFATDADTFQENLQTFLQLY